jgi:hypothetical protein
MEDISTYKSASLILSKALNLLMEDGKGIFLKDVTDEKKNYIVMKKNESIHIFNSDRDLEDGTLLNSDPQNTKI